MAAAQSAMQAHLRPGPPPTIKGIFVNSHIHAVRRRCGPEGLARLEAAMGGPLDYGDFDDVPIRDEVRLIEAANDILSEAPVPPEARAFEGGRLHFRNFKGTPIARMMFAIFPRNYRYLILHTPSIAERVFKGVGFEARETGPREIEVVMENNDYPLDHFRGLFQEWMDDFGYRGLVEGRQSGPARYTYVMRWTDP